MNKIYLGNTEVANVGSGSGGGQEFNPSDYVDASTWNEHEKVIASALVDLKKEINYANIRTRAVNNKLDNVSTELQNQLVIKQNKNNVYTKAHIDEIQLVIAEALTQLETRISALESHIQTA